MSYELNPPFDERERELLEELRSRTNVANAVASARVRLGLTQKELGTRAGTKQSRISELEGLQGNLRFDTLDRITRVLGLMIDLVPRVDTIAIASTSSRARPYRGLHITVEDSGEYAVCLPNEWSAKAEL